MMKRKLRLGALLSVSVLMLALLIGGLYGAFSDEETSTGNTFSAGSLNLVSAISGVGYSELHEEADGINDYITFGAVKPGDAGSITWTLTNQGSLDGLLGLGVTVAGDENVCTEPELAMIPADDDTASELIDKLYCTVTIDGGAPSVEMSLADLQTYLDGYSGGLAASVSRVILVEWEADPADFDNYVQTDTAQIDITFTLTQV